MDEDRLISKKDVLRITGISYGQLYRWKRKGLIPEEWFIRRATFTGQETFFPRDKIVPRIEQIKRMKEDHPLDDLAELITTQVNEKLEIAFSRLSDLGWLTEPLIEIYKLDQDKGESIPLSDAFCLGVLRRLQNTARNEELELVKRTLDTTWSKGLIERVRAEELELYLLRKHIAAGGLSAEISTVIVAPPGVLIDPDLTVVATVDLRLVIEEIKLDLAADATQHLQRDLSETAAGIKEEELNRFKQRMRKEEQ